MKLKVLLFVAAAFQMTCLSAASYRFLAFNVWGDYFGNPPEERDLMQVEILGARRPDFISLQEVTSNFWKSRLMSGMADRYEILGRSMGPDGIDSYTPLLFLRDRFELLEKGCVHFHPSLDPSKGVVWAALKDRSTSAKIVVFSTHFWWRYDGKADDYLRRENARMLYEAVSAAAARHGAAIVGGGDLNATPNSATLKAVKEKGWKNAQETTVGAIRCKTWRTAPERDSKGVLRGVLPENAERSLTLDYVLYSPSRVRPVSFAVDRSRKALDASDHSPVTFGFELVDEPAGGWREPRRLGSLDAVPRTPDEKGWWMKRFRQKAPLVAGEKGKVLFIGDSITHGWESRGKDQWGRYFSGAPYHAVNFGFSADRTEHVLWRLQNCALERSGAKAVVLMIGTNNTGHHPFAKCPPADVIVGIKAIIDLIRERMPQARIVLHPIFPRGEQPSSEARMRNETVNREIVKFADGRNVIWCDFNDRLLDANGVLSREIMPDLLHPNDRGYEIWANELMPVLDRVMSAKPGEPVAGRYAAHPWTDPKPAYAPGCRPCTRLEAAGSRGQWWWLNRLGEKRGQIAASEGEFDLVMIGDSITHFWEYDFFSCGWDVYRRLCSRYRVLNLGYGGDSTGNVIWRCENGELDGYRAKCVMVMIGTNNRTAPKETAEGIKRIIALVAGKQPDAKIILSPIFPRGAPDDKRRAVNEEVNSIIKGLADGDRVVWLDFNGRFLREDGSFRPNMMTDDLLHPYAGGYEVWLDAMLPLLGQVCGGGCKAASK